MKERIARLKDHLHTINVEIQALSKEQGVTLDFIIEQDKKSVFISATPDNQNVVPFTIRVAKATVNTEL